MTEVVAFSGVGNTGKTTLLYKLSKYASYSGMQVAYCEETAFDIAKTLFGGFEKIDNITLFHKAINAMEHERVERLKEERAKELFDLILVDRTFLDHKLYYRHNVESGNATKCRMKDDPGSKEIYDKVITFDTPIVTDPNFTHYNDKEFVKSFPEEIKSYYPQTIPMRNGMVNEKDVLNMLRL